LGLGGHGKKDFAAINFDVGNVFLSYLAISASCFKIVLAKVELHLPSLASG
jgi:hypothetical protein